MYSHLRLEGDRVLWVFFGKTHESRRVLCSDVCTLKLRQLLVLTFPAVELSRLGTWRRSMRRMPLIVQRCQGNHAGELLPHRPQVLDLSGHLEVIPNMSS